MTTPTGGFDPLQTSPSSDTPIGDGLARDTLQAGPARSTTSDASAKDAADSAASHASDVAGTAADEASNVASEAKDKAAELLTDLKGQLGEQSSTQLQGLASKLEELGDQIQDLVSGAQSSGQVADVAQQLADRTHALGAHLEGKEPLELLEDVRNFARRRPTTFLVGAALAGVAAGRLTRGAKASSDTGAPTPSSPSTAVPAATPTTTTTTTDPAGSPASGDGIEGRP